MIEKTRVLVAIAIGLFLALVLTLFVSYVLPVHAQTRTDTEQDRTQALNAQAAEQRQAVARKQANDIQDKAVVKDQLRQDRASAEAREELAAVLATKTTATNVRQDASTAVNSAKIATIEDQSITDRQFMILLVAAMGGIMFAVWLMSHRASAKLQIAAAATHDAIDKLLVVKQATLEAVQELRSLTQKLGDRTDAKLDNIETNQKISG